MGAVIEICAGRVHVFKQGEGTGGVGYYQLDPPVQVASGSRCLIMGAPIEQREINQPVVTLDDQRILYAFGAAWSQATVMLKILLGDNSSGGAALGAAQAWYNQHRLSKLLETPLKLSIGNKAHAVFLVGHSIGAADAQFNTQDIALTFMLSED